MSKHPFDLIDLGFMLVAPTHPAMLVVCVAQYWARRSTWVAEAFVEAGLLHGLPDNQFAREALPGAARLLLPPVDGNHQPATSAGKATQPLEISPSATHTVALGGIGNDDNVLIVGPKGSGKTTLLRRLITMRHGKHIALDPHGTPNKWPCNVAGAGLEWDDISRVLMSGYTTMDRRYKAMAKGAITEEQCRQRRYTLLADEYRAISKALPRSKDVLGASEILMEVLTQGRKAGIAVLVAAHADTVKALGIEGEGDLRTSFDWIIYLGGMATKKVPEAGKMKRPAVAYHPERDEYYLLNISETTDGLAKAGHAAHSGLEPETNNAVLGALLGVAPADNSSSALDDKLHHLSSEFQPLERGVAGSSSVAESDVSAAETAYIVLQLQRGKKPGQIAKALPGYNGRNYKVYRAKVDAVLKMLDSIHQENEMHDDVNADDDGPDPDIGPFGRYLP